MKQLYLTFLFIVGFSIFGFSQSNEKLFASNKVDDTIENLSIYPNPATQGKIYIVSEPNTLKKIEIFNVLGKLILSVSQTTNELNISKLKQGVYILKITEKDITATRKLIVR